MTRRRLAAALLLTWAVFAVPALVWSPAASAHPLGNFTVNRYSGLDLSPGKISVRYVVDMAEIPTYQETPNIDTDGDGTVTGAERQAWADRTAPVLLSHIRLTVAGSAVPLAVARAELRFRSGQAGLPILRLEATFSGTLPATTGAVSYQDSNYPGRIGWKEITVRSQAGVAISGASVPAASISHELATYPTAMLSSPLNVTAAAFSFHPGSGTAALASSASRATVADAPVASGGAFAGLVRWRLTPVVLGLSLVLAFAFGAVHALGPGHGKTITAAYLVGAGAKRSQAIVIGVAVSFMHTASVLGLGAVFLILATSFPPERVYPWLEMVTGLVALGLGAALLVVRVRARRRGADPWHGHTHPWDHPADAEEHAPHYHEHPHDAERDRPVTGRSLLALAVAGGILPSPTAFVVLLGAVRAHRIGYGLALIFAFSVGLAAALVVVGLFALRARALVSRRLAGRWAGLIPIGSAALILGFGVFFATRGTAQLI